MSSLHHDDLYEEEPLPEGEEKAPPLTHTMGIVRWIILGGMTLFALVMILGSFGITPWAQTGTGTQQYHCPMHPTYVSSQPGDCPICGMSLVPMDNNAKADSSATTAHGGVHGKESVAKPGQYYCPMDPEVASDTEGKCPTCGMSLEKFEPGMKFTCEMHPEVISDKPGDCPKCGMDLMPLEPDAASDQRSSEMADMGSAPVPGLVPVAFEPQRLQLIGVKTGKVEKRLLGASTRMVGYVVPDESKIRNLNVRSSGWVQKLNVDQTGQRVANGQTLLTLYSQELYQAVQDHLLALQSTEQQGGDSVLAANKVNILAASRERLKLLGLSDDEVARAETSGSGSSDLSLRSPFDGVVLEKSVVQGQYITPSQSLFTIADLRTVWVLADLYESDLAALRIGQSASMTVAAFPGERFEGTISFIYPTVSSDTRTLKVRMEFANATMQLRPGMYAEVELQSGGESALAIPREAMMDGGEIVYAFVVTNGTRFEPRRIEIGRRSDDWVEVTSGLRENETVVTSANFLIDSESRLKAAITGMGSAQADPHAGHGK